VRRDKSVEQIWIGKQGYQQQHDYQYDKQNQLIQCDESTAFDETVTLNAQV